MANVYDANELRRAVDRDKLLPFAFATSFLVIGMSAASLGYALGHVPEVGVRRPFIYPHDWMFWAVWFVLYPAMGIAGYHLWRQRHLRGSGLAWKLYLAGYAVNLSWVPIVHLARSPVAMPAVMDAIAGAALLPALWTIALWNRPAFLWSIPILVWGPITQTLKIWQLLLNRNLYSTSTWHWVEWSIYAGALEILLQLVIAGRGVGRQLPDRPA